MNNTIKQITATALIGAAAFSLSTTTIQADEGQWQPHQIANMQDKFDQLGLKLPAHQVANLTQYPMNAMVGLGYCSASFVSPKGLVVTNHHCAYGAIQYNTTPEQNRIRDGFLARDHSEELSAGPQERLYITEKVTDVTQQVLGAIESTTSGKKYYDAIQDARKKLIKDCESDKNYRCSVRSFHHGKEYFLLKKLMIKDVRLVYAPPEGVGEFGGDIDNFEYPRHTGDFTFVRAYVDKNGNPAPYHKDNVPYEPKSYLKISAAGVKEGDGIILAGTPGRTSRYKLASEIKFAASWDYPMQVERALQTLDIIERFSNKDVTTKVAYSSTIKSINNRMKKRQGLLDGFKVTNIHAIKKDKEQQLLRWIGADKKRQKYAKTHQQLSSLIDQSHALDKQAFYYDYATESTLIQVATSLYRLAKESEKPDAMRKMGYQERNLPMIKARLKRMNKRFVKKVDQAIWTHFLTHYAKRPKNDRIAEFDKTLGLGGPLSVSEITSAYYSSTNLDDKKARLAWIGKPVSEFRASKDPFIIFAVKMYETTIKMEAKMDELRGQLAQVRPRYMEAIIAYNESLGNPVYPDANGTLRITIGSVGGYPAADGIYKTPFTSVKGMMLKHTGKAPFKVPAKVQDAYTNNRFGSYRQAQLENGKRFNDIPVNFLSSADTTGGNSGSPVLNGRGELVGLNFDSTYESITKDWYFNAEITRAIHVDIRYVLWLLDEVEQADHLIKEMNVIYNR